MSRENRLGITRKHHEVQNRKRRSRSLSCARVSSNGDYTAMRYITCHVHFDLVALLAVSGGTNRIWVIGEGPRLLVVHDSVPPEVRSRWFFVQALGGTQTSGHTLQGRRSLAAPVLRRNKYPEQNKRDGQQYVPQDVGLAL